MLDFFTLVKEVTILSVKIGLIGEIKGVSRKKINDKIIMCLEIDCKSMKNTHQQLRTIMINDSDPIHYTVIVREKIYNKLVKEMNDTTDNLLGKEIYVIGVPVLDLPMSIVEGEIGIFAYHLEDAIEKKIEIRSSAILKKNALSELQIIKPKLEKKIMKLESKIFSLENQNQSVTFWIDVDEIECPNKSAYEPKVNEAVDYYKSNGHFPGEIRVKIKDNQWFVADGYSKLVAAKRLSLKRVKVIYKS